VSTKTYSEVQTFENKTYGIICWSYTGDASGDSTGEASGGCVGVLVGNEVMGTGVGKLKERKNDSFENQGE
jgi:hypothetical protein